MAYYIYFFLCVKFMKYGTNIDLHKHKQLSDDLPDGQLLYFGIENIKTEVVCNVAGNLSPTC
jgi:hypothetical protein